jgi:transcriptional regulator with XRE-family HTH domain
MFCRLTRDLGSVRGTSSFPYSYIYGSFFYETCQLGFAKKNLIMQIIPMTSVGSRVRTLRTERKMTLPALAERSGLSKGLLSKLENNEDANPSLETLFKVAEAFEVTLAEILESEQAQIKKVTPTDEPVWLEGLVKYLKANNRELDKDILNAMYVLRHRKAAKKADLEQWIFLYQSIEKSFAK